jgi:hypothetical protein
MDWWCSEYSAYTLDMWSRSQEMWTKTPSHSTITIFNYGWQYGAQRFLSLGTPDNWKQTSTWSKLLHPGYINLTLVSSTPVYKPRCHVGTNAQCQCLATRRSDMYHLLPMCNVKIEVTTKLSVSQCLLLFVLNRLVRGLSCMQSYDNFRN